ncbi:tumor necrosis factor receptor superfamily member 25 isoform X5 [Sorex araneus]|uniref:tumor necrosis factor receptor superfamily member 25 isoform X5 n=1 Tax=Sorex araneus TaxID=42254 RepID=UPI0024338E3E|nr:tumor necrosis factor receptor superfamily member 25 isoform X5 [Sorex araneus]
MAQENHHYERCARCRFCDEEALQMTVRNCSAVANTVCGCKPGLFPSCWDHGCVDPGEHLLCSPCADCGTLNRRPLAACEDPLDAAPPRWPPPTPGPPRHLLPAVSQGQEECGGCLDGFYEHDKECVSCPNVLGPGAPGSAGGPTPAWRPLDLHVPSLPRCRPRGVRGSPDGGAAAPPGQCPLPPAAPQRPPGRQQLDARPLPGPGGALPCRPLGQELAAQPGSRPAARARRGPGGRRAPAGPAAVRRDRRGARALLEGVRAHAGAARGRDRGGGGGGGPLPRPAV